MKIRLCKHSPKGKNRCARELQKALPEADIKVKGCLKKCALCRMQPFALLDGQMVVSAGTWEELRQQVLSSV